MKRYNINNYVIYHKDLEQSMPEGKMWDEYTRDELIIKFMPLSRKLSKKVCNFTSGYRYTIYKRFDSSRTHRFNNCG